MDRYLCIHCHFYQPPRENPWLGEIEYQESAYPYHDWNERIDVECYRANGASRILDSAGRVVELANNYAKISFNFGPTLLSWLEDKDPATYRRILEGDRISREHFDGHGSALAQAYNHTILPLASPRDRETQILWGLHDFQRRFQRDPEAMWLPETAVNTETLEVLAANGMKFVILAPRQAKAVRSLTRDEPWQDVSGEKVDPKHPYLVRLPSGRSIAAFFYDGPISKAVAFEGLLHNGERFANRLLGGYSGDPQTPQLVHIATDGESYGHHHPHGDMALAYAIHHIEKNKLATVTNYGQFLSQNPPQFEAEIHENSSWSCAHGVDRWKNDCGCNSGMHRGWNQKWREPLRDSLDWLRGQLDEPYDSTMKEYVEDPWAMRNDYIRVISDRSRASTDEFLRQWSKRELGPEETVKVLKALETQHQSLLMYTSCGWFFDEISGIETVQNLQYAYRAIELAEQVFCADLLAPFAERLEKASSNIPGLQNGRTVFDRYVLPAKVDYLRLGIHFAVASIFEEFGERNEIYNSEIRLLEFNRFEAGRAKMACGQAEIESKITRERYHMTFGVVHLGDHNVNAGIKFYESDDQYNALLTDAKTAFERADFPTVIRVFDRYFGSSMYSLKDLFKDEQRRIVEAILGDTMQDVEERMNRMYRNNYPLLCYLSDLSFPLPKVFNQIAEFVQNHGIRKTLKAPGRLRTEVVRKYLEEARNWGVPLDAAGLRRVIEEVVEDRMSALEKDDSNIDRLEELLELVHLETEIPFTTDLGPVQNRFFLWYRKNVRGRKIPDTPEGQRWLALAERLGEELRVILPE